MEKLNVAVIFGGCSPEYSVSLESAHAVVTHMDRTRYNPVLIGISSAGNWYHFTGAAEKIKSDTFGSDNRWYGEDFSGCRFPCSAWAQRGGWDGAGAF